MKRTVLLFDMDGVLVDSNAMHRDSWIAVAERHGLPVRQAEVIGRCGLTTHDVVTKLLRWTEDDDEAERLGEEKEICYRAEIARGGIPAIPGVVDYVKKAAAAGYACAIGTSAPRENMETCLAVLGLRECFRACLPSGRGMHGKPAPDIYLAAAAAIGAAPETCVVFEDAANGIAAAKAAGMRAVGILTAATKEELFQADAWYPDFRSMPLPPFAD
jgi:HAD superfamily hydrolase (TIGR01509 family)